MHLHDHTIFGLESKTPCYLGTTGGTKWNILYNLYSKLLEALKKDYQVPILDMCICKVRDVQVVSL